MKTIFQFTIMSVIKEVSRALATSLIRELPVAVSDDFNIDEDDFRDFLNEFISKNVALSSRGSLIRTPRPKGKNGKCATNGYRVYCKDARKYLKKKYPDMGSAEMMKTMGAEWSALSDEEQNYWYQKADEENRENGLEATNTRASRDIGSRDSTRSSCPTTKDSKTGLWVIKTTPYVVRSSRKKIIYGKLSEDGNVEDLSDEDIEYCESMGWRIEDVEYGSDSGSSSSSSSESSSSSSSSDSD